MVRSNYVWDAKYKYIFMPFFLFLTHLNTYCHCGTFVMYVKE